MLYISCSQSVFCLGIEQFRNVDFVILLSLFILHFRNLMHFLSISGINLSSTSYFLLLNNMELNTQLFISKVHTNTLQKFLAKKDQPVMN